MAASSNTTGGNAQPANAPLQETLTPTPIDRQQIGFSAYFKQALKPLAVTAGAWITGFFVQNLAKSAMPEEFEHHPYRLANWFGSVAGVYSAFITWGKTEKKRLGVSDIEDEVREAASPVVLQKELEQNAHIQDGIRKIVASGPQTSHAGAILDRPAEPPAKTV